MKCSFSWSRCRIIIAYLNDISSAGAELVRAVLMAHLIMQIGVGEKEISSFCRVGRRNQSSLNDISYSIANPLWVCPSFRVGRTHRFAPVCTGCKAPSDERLFRSLSQLHANNGLWWQTFRIIRSRMHSHGYTNYLPIPTFHKQRRDETTQHKTSALTRYQPRVFMMAFLNCTRQQLNMNYNIFIICSKTTKAQRAILL